MSLFKLFPVSNLKTSYSNLLNLKSRSLVFSYYKTPTNLSFILSRSSHTIRKEKIVAKNAKVQTKEPETRPEPKTQESLSFESNDLEIELINTVNLNKKLSQLTTDFIHKLSQLRTGKTEPTMLDEIKITAYEKKTNLKEISQISFVSAKLFQVTVFDPTLVKNVEKALRESHLKLNPSVDNNTISVPIPKTTKENREETAKIAKNILEFTKKQALEIRRVALKIVKNKKGEPGVSDDFIFKEEQRVDTEVKKCEKNLQDICNKKEKDILTE